MAKSTKAYTAGAGSLKKRAADKAKVNAGADADVEQPLPKEASKNSATAPPSLTAEERRIQVLLGQGVYHLPSNKTWYQDFGSYVCNNHPLLAVCFQSPLHPIGKGMRAVGLLGSICFGLVLTNAIYMWQLYGQDEAEDSDETVFALSAGGFAVSNGTSVTYLNDDSVISQYAPGFEISSTAMIVLWTVGSASHTIFDSLLWYASSCQCCSASGKSSDNKTQSKSQSNLRKYCNILIVLLVVLVTTVATLAVVVRAMLEDDDGSDSLNAMLDQNNGNTTNPELLQLLSQNSATPLKNKNNYGFLQAYAIELALAWFLWFFLIEGLLFSGVLSCRQRCFPSVLGGRPYEVQQEQQELKAAEATRIVRNSKTAASTKKKKQKESSPKHPSDATNKKNTKRTSSASAEANKTPHKRASTRQG